MKSVRYILSAIFFLLTLNSISASAQKCDRVIVYLIDGLHWQAPEKLNMPVLNRLIDEGVYIQKSYTIIPHHPTVGDYSKYNSCSFPNPMLQEGTIFLRPDNKMIQEMISPKRQTAIIVNTTAYSSIGRGFSTCIMNGSLSDDEVVSKSIDILENKDIEYMRIHLQSPGSIGTRIAMDSDGKPYSKNIFGPDSPYVQAVENGDKQLGRLVEYLNKSGKWAGTVLIVTSDHGQSSVGWHPMLDRDSWTTPLVFAGKGIAKGRKLPYFEQIDLAPTIAWLLGVKAPNIDGGAGKAVKAIMADQPETSYASEQYLLTINNQIREYNLLYARMTLEAEHDSNLANVLASLPNQNLTPEPFYDQDRIMDWYKAGTIEHLVKANDAVLEKMRKALAAASASEVSVKEKPASQVAFEKLFGDIAKLDPCKIEMVKNDSVGKRHYFDLNGDGRPEEVWFIDVEPRHTQDKRPILVKVVDQSGELGFNKEPRKCGAVWVADQHADGVVDSIIAYNDVDGDGDLDNMEWYVYGIKNERVPIDGIRLLYSIDDGDDNLLDYDINYRYYQIPCQNFSHFGGDESFVVFYLNAEHDKWIPYFENPFLFYDSDKDGITEEVIRVQADNDMLATIRWSFNTAPNSNKPRDYDVSLSAYAQGWEESTNMASDFKVRLSETETFTIRGIPSGPVLKRSEARNYLNGMTWAREMMTWNENNLNIEFEDPNNTIERWEGVINPTITLPGYYMPGIGAPDCGIFNKRFELLMSPSTVNEYYFNPADMKVHLKNADKVWMDADFDYDGKTDMRYRYIDSDKDGYIDKVTLFIDEDDEADDSWDINISGIRKVSWTFESLNRVMKPVFEREPEKKYRLISALESALKTIDPNAEKDAVWSLINAKYRGIHLSDDISDRLLSSDKSLLYYLTLAQDRMIVLLKNSGYGNSGFWEKFNKARSEGNTAHMTKILRRFFAQSEREEPFSEWIKRLREPKPERKVAYNNSWLPPNWGWESDKAAFRFYLGHFDLFGKREGFDTLVMPDIQEDYHIEQDWGMDILHVGKTSGCGGLILYVDGKAYPVRNESGRGNPTFSGKLLEESDNFIRLELVAEGVGPADSPYKVTIRPSARAGVRYSDIQVTVEGGKPNDRIELGVGMVRLTDETFHADKEAGIMGSWGFQDPQIGMIGMGITYNRKQFVRFDEQAEEHRVVLKCKRNVPVEYRIECDWLRGHRFPVYPSPQDWFDKLKSTAYTSNK